MLRWLRDLLYETAPAEFRSSYSVVESVQRLSAATSRWGFSVGETRAVGKVAPESVRLQRVIPMVRNGFKPFFVGRFETRDGGTVLAGHFGMSAFAKVFVTAWLTMAAVFAAVFLAAHFISKPPSSAWLPIVPLVMLAGGIGLVSLGKWFARNDAAWLSGVISQALSAPGETMPKEPEIEPSGTPLLLKGVALFLAAWSVLLVVASILLFAEAHMVPSPWRAAFAVAAFVVAAGVWRRRPWAWWGGFVIPGAWAVTAVRPMMYNGPPDPESPPLVIIVAFAVVGLAVAGFWAVWWYAQRRYFLWQRPPAP
jgi:hypothetical protein